MRKFLIFVVVASTLYSNNIESKTINDIENIQKDGATNVRIVPIDEYNQEVKRAAERVQEAKEKKIEAVVAKVVNGQIKEITNEKESFFKKETAKVGLPETQVIEPMIEQVQSEVFAIDGRENYVKTLTEILVKLEKSKLALDGLTLHGFNKVRVWNEFKEFENKIQTQITALQVQDK